MALSLNKPKLDNLAGDIWKSAERLRGKFKPYEYQGVILPIIVIRRLECVLLGWREAKRAEVLAKRPKLTEKELAKLVKKLELNPKQSPFSNKTYWTLRKVYEEDHTLLEENFRAYVNGFSKNVDDIVEHFNYRATIGLMVKNNRLAPILNQYKELELGPDQLSPLEMGYIYEELLRRFSEQSGEEAEITSPRARSSVSWSSCWRYRSRTGISPYMTPLAAQAAWYPLLKLGNSLIPHDPHTKEPGP